MKNPYTAILIILSFLPVSGFAQEEQNKGYAPDDAFIEGWVYVVDKKEYNKEFGSRSEAKKFKILEEAEAFVENNYITTIVKEYNIAGCKKEKK